MRFSIVVLGAPYDCAASLSALNYIRAALAEGHDIHRVFFHQDGVLNANALATPPQDERDMVRAWSELAAESGVELVVCIASALRRGVLDDTEAERYDKGKGNLAAGFTISGLGQLIDACIASDRVMTFGA